MVLHQPKPSTRLSPHEKLTARIAHGLEPSLVNNERVTITALESDDPPAFALRVAGPAALLTAKAIKIGERLGQADTQPDRLKEKDTLDAFRILQAIDTPHLVEGFAKHQEDEHASAVTAEATEVTGPTPPHRKVASPGTLPAVRKTTRRWRQPSQHWSPTYSRRCKAGHLLRGRLGAFASADTTASPWSTLPDQTLHRPRE